MHGTIGPLESRVTFLEGDFFHASLHSFVDVSHGGHGTWGRVWMRMLGTSLSLALRRFHGCQKSLPRAKGIRMVIQRSMTLGNDQRPPSLNCPHGKGELKEMQHNDQERNAKGVRSSLHDGEVGIVSKGQDTQD